MDVEYPSAVIFDVDGTLGDTERHGHRVAFNRAFEAQGLDDRWDEDLYGELLAVAGGEARLRHWFGLRGLEPARARSLATTLHRVKTAAFAEVVRAGLVEPRPGIPRLLDDLTAAGVRLAVATTGSRAWVEPFLEHVLARTHTARFEVVVTGDDVATLKPDPEAYLVALERLRLTAAGVVAVEDSQNGVRAARAAGLVCLGVPGEYGGPDDVDGASLVLDGFGERGRPARVLRDPYAIGLTKAIVDATLLARLLTSGHARG